MAVFQRPRTMAESVYQHLRHELFTGHLEEGQWLREQELAAQLEVSRTPVREAIRQLAQEGLLVIEANRGVYVPKLGLEEAVATYEVRERLEGMAARLAAVQIDDDGRRRLRAVLAAMDEAPRDDPAEHIRLDDELHALIANLSRNPVLEELVEKLSYRVMRVKIVTRDVNVTKLAHSQHAMIVAVITKGDADAAEAAMSEHIRSNLEIVKGRLEAKDRQEASAAHERRPAKGEAA